MIRGTTLATEQIRRDYESPHANLDRAGRTEIGVLLAEIDALREDLSVAMLVPRALRVAMLRTEAAARKMRDTLAFVPLDGSATFEQREAVHAAWSALNHALLEEK